MEDSLPQQRSVSRLSDGARRYGAEGLTVVGLDLFGEAPEGHHAPFDGISVELAVDEDLVSEPNGYAFVVQRLPLGGTAELRDQHPDGVRPRVDAADPERKT